MTSIFDSIDSALSQTDTTPATYAVLGTALVAFVATFGLAPVKQSAALHSVGLLSIVIAVCFFFFKIKDSVFSVMG